VTRFVYIIIFRLSSLKVPLSQPRSPLLKPYVSSVSTAAGSRMGVL